jgi:hypothetical protein
MITSFELVVLIGLTMLIIALVAELDLKLRLKLSAWSVLRGNMTMKK